MATEFVEEVPTINVRDKNVVFVRQDGGKCAMPLRIARLTNAILTTVLNEHDHGTVIAFPRPKRPRKPSTKDA